MKALALIAILMAAPAVAEDMNMRQYFAGCVVTNGLAAEFVGNGDAAAFMVTIAQWYAVPLTEAEVREVADAIQRDYNSGALSWDEIIAFAQDCATEQETNLKAWKAEHETAP